MKISDSNRAEFEQRGVEGVRNQIRQALYSAEKQKEAYEWLDQQEHKAAWASVRIATIAPVFSGISILTSIASVVIALCRN
jgi:hypothetical protein